jgi:myo-inositol-1(or 4)-monophosphatase
VASHDLDALLDAARDAAAAATRLLRQARPADIRAKDNLSDLVTEWDLRAEEVIRERLAVRTPDIGVLGEEGVGVGAGAATSISHAGAARWLVDPIDGTLNFAHGLPLWGVSIGLEIAGASVVGVVAAPALGYTFWARQGGGAFLDTADGTERMQVSATGDLRRAMLVTGFPADSATNPDNNLAQFEHFQRRSAAVRRLGSASLDLCFVARGWFDGYWERRLKPWDVGAGAVLVTEAGGRVTDTRGAGFTPSRGDVLASNGAIHEVMLIQLAAADASVGSSSR